jgi:5-deoxy-5-amino-3-dehydroquinate synthase
LVITQEGIPFAIADDLKSAGLAVSSIMIGDGEEHKSLSTIEAIMAECASIGLTRNDVIVGVGGGMVTDVAGFAASLWHRGIAAVHVSTTLVGMVDAAIGGKTGVNLATGKNLVGSFWQPRAVFCDTDALTSLSPREIRCGHGEMAKYHFLTGDNLLALELAERIARCVQIKADIVGADEREGGRRMLLNYGHTLAHALEIATDFSLAHGEAVAIGLVYAAHVAHQLGRIDQHRVDQHRAVVTGEYGLSCALPTGVSHEQLIQLMHGDKKALTGLTFVLDGPRGVEPVTSVDLAAVRQALHCMEVR